MACVENNDVIEALATDRADNALHIGVLPGRAQCRDDLLNSHGSNSLAKAVVAGELRPLSAGTRDDDAAEGFGGHQPA